MKDDVRPERFGKRLVHYSTWHRERAGTLTYVTDIDWLEYRHRREGVALIEAKMYPGKIKWPQRTALADLAAARRPLPFFCVTYDFTKENENVLDNYRFEVEPLNELARDLTTKCDMSSEEYAAFLRSL